MELHFDGATYRLTDRPRLGSQYARVWHAMRCGRWFTLRELEMLTGDPAASISARMRDFRKERFGENTVETRDIGRGLWLYRLIPSPTGDAIVEGMR